MTEEKRDDKATERVVLRRERVLVLPENIADEQVKEAQKVIRSASSAPGSGRDTEAWVVVGPAEGSSKPQAVEALAGKPGTPDAKPGVYRAPSARSWAGGVVYERPEDPKVERRLFEN